jgi:ABC-type transport system involved in cytochrome bd biosynthesis fused ATPase/permease subunit
MDDRIEEIERKLRQLEEDNERITANEERICRMAVVMAAVVACVIAAMVVSAAGDGKAAIVIYAIVVCLTVIAMAAIYSADV